MSHLALKAHRHACLGGSVSDDYTINSGFCPRGSKGLKKVDNHRKLYVSDSKMTVRRYFMHDCQLISKISLKQKFFLSLSMSHRYTM